MKPTNSLRRRKNKRPAIKAFKSFLGMALLFLGTLSACNTGTNSNNALTQKAATQPDSYYTCSMHPHVHEDKPGHCPICGMPLVKVKLSENTDSIGIDSSLTYLAEPPSQVAIGVFKTITPKEITPNDTIFVTGQIAFDQRKVNTVSSRVSGRIDKLFVHYTGQKVVYGQPLMNIYSPELLSAQRNLLQVVQDKNQRLTTAMTQKLINLGMSSEEINKVITSGQVLPEITIYSGYTGILQQPPAMAKMAMNGDGSTATLNIRKGMYVSRGQALLSIQNARQPWAVLNVFTQDAWKIKTNDSVQLYSEANPNKVINGNISFIPPFRNKQSQTTQVRVYLNEMPDNWKIGTLIHGEIVIKSRFKGWYLPASAVNDLGTNDVVWVQDKNHKNVFHATKVNTGGHVGNSVEVVSGIRRGDKVALNAEYMVGSEGIIR